MTLERGRALVSAAIAPGIAITLVALAVAGCAGESKGISEKALSTVVLQPNDLPSEFRRFDEGAPIAADTPGGERSNPGRFGRTAGWKARYRRPGTPATRGPLVIESRVDVFEDADGAERDVSAFRRDAVAAGWRVLRAPRVGDTSVALALRQGSGRFATHFFMVAWKHRNASGSILANGFEGKVAFTDALALARKQQLRLERASREM